MALEEYSIIVDENDKVIDYKPRGSVTRNERMRIVVVWLENEQGQALIHKRSMTKKAGPGRWENAAGGGVAKGESYAEAALKEAEEEIGLKGVDLEFVAKNIVKTDRGERYCAWFKAKIDWPVEQFVLEPTEVVEVKWIDKSELFDARDKNPDAYMPSSSYWRELFTD